MTQQPGKSFDRGQRYRSVIFSNDEAQRVAAEESKRKLEKSGRFDKPIVTENASLEILQGGAISPGAYSTKNPLRYRFYRHNCGRINLL